MNDNSQHPARVHAPIQQLVAKPRPKLAIYGAGAFGIKNTMRASTSAGIEDTRLTYIDTSDANLTKEVPEEKVYRIRIDPEEGKSERGGAGQDRRRATKAILPHIPKILEAHPPGHANILIASSSGASGASFLVLMARELIKRDQTFFIITVGELSTTKYLNNTRDTRATLENISLSLGRPIVHSYFENSPGMLPSVVDDEVQFVIEAIQSLVIPFNEDLDETDVYNALNFSKITGVEPQLAALTVTDNMRAASAVLEPITSLSLFAKRDDYRVPGTPIYHKAGYPEEPLLLPFNELHFVINTISVDEMAKRLKETETSLKQTHSAYRQRGSLVDRRDLRDQEDEVIFSD